jgi:phosphoribosyl-dephospho-CoA transferase
MNNKVILSSVRINPEMTHDDIANQPSGALVHIDINAFVDGGIETETMLQEIFDQAMKKIMTLINDYKPGYNPATTYLVD